MILSFDEYKELGGIGNHTTFNAYSYEAEAKINTETHGRIKNCVANESIKRCIVRVTDILAKHDITKDNVSSWSNDGVSESYTSHTSEEVAQTVKSIIKTYLANEVDSDGVPLLYLGVS